MSRILLTSDLHIGHRLVAGLRGYDDVADHDRAVMDNLAAQLDEHDTLFVLGDLALGQYCEAIAMIASLPGTKHLVVGNHEKCFAGNRDAHKHQRAYFEAFDSVAASVRLKIAGTELLLSHFPYEGDTEGREQDRHQQFRLPDLGTPLVHGHTHDAITHRVSRLGTPMLHVGLDARGMRAVTADDLLHELEQMRP